MKVTFQQEYTRCHNERCSNCANGGEGHGPYWYGYTSIDGKTKKKYFGKKRPTQADGQEKFTAKGGAKSKERTKEPPRTERERTYTRPDEPRFAWAQKMSMTAALRIMGLEPGYTKTALKTAYRALVQQYHPDKARTAEKKAEYTEILKAINAANEYLQRVQA